jgi:type IV secretory pathway TraG/TraD family ATPase VirD4
MSQQANLSKDEQLQEDIGRLIMWFIVGVAVLSVLPALIVGLVIHAIFVKVLKKDAWLYLTSIFGIVGLFVLYAKNELTSVFGFVSSLNMPFVSPIINQVFNQGKTIETSVLSFIGYISIGIVLAVLYRLYEVFLKKKEIVSKKSQIAKKRNSKAYQDFKKKRMEFLAKKQTKYRKSHDISNFIGYTEYKERLELDDRELNQHMFAIGTTGAGKTTVIAALMECALKRNKPIIFVDGKGDRNTINDLTKLANGYKRTVRVFSDLDSVTYNPLKYGTPTVVRDKLMALFEWSEPYYKTQSSRFLQLLAGMMNDYHLQQDLHTFYHYMNPSELKSFLESQVIEQVIEEEIEIEVDETSNEESVSEENADHDELVSAFGANEKPITQKTAVATKKMVKQIKKTVVKVMDDKAKYYYQKFFSEIDLEAIGNLRNQIAELLESDLGELFREKPDGIDLRKSTEDNEVVIFSLSGNKYQDYIKSLSRFVIMDVNNLVDYRAKTGRKSIFAVYDEFSAYASAEIVDIVNKSRSAGFECLISTQGLSDIDSVSETLTRQILNNTNTYLVGRVNDEADAERLAKIIGTYEDQELTQQAKQELDKRYYANEMGSAREVDRFKAHPNEIKNLQTGEIFICRKLLEDEETKTAYTRRAYVRNALDLGGLE